MKALLSGGRNGLRLTRGTSSIFSCYPTRDYLRIRSFCTDAQNVDRTYQDAFGPIEVKGRVKDSRYPWTCGSVPRKFWDDRQNHRKYMDWLAKELNHTSMEDWYKVKNSDFVTTSGASFIAKNYRNLVMRAVLTVYPEHTWYPWMFEKLPQGFWEDKTMQRRYLDWLGEKIEFKEKEDWYKVKQAYFIQNYGWGLVHLFGNAVSKVVMGVYNDHEWQFWMFDGLPKGFWEIMDNQRKYCDWLGKKLGYETFEDWYKVRIVDFAHNHGWTIVYSYENTPAKALQKVYPEHDWEVWLFETIPKGFWDDKKNHKKYLTWLGKKLGFTEMVDWHYIKRSHLQQHGAANMLIHYDNNLITMVTQISFNLL